MLVLRCSLLRKGLFSSEEARGEGRNGANRCGFPDSLSTLPVWDVAGVFGSAASFNPPELLLSFSHRLLASSECC